MSLRSRAKDLAYLALTRVAGDAGGMVTLPVLSGPARGLWFRVDLVKRKEAYFWGKYDRSILERVLPLIQPGWTIWDCGTYLGYYSAIFARLVPRGRVVAIDLDSRNLQRTRENVRLNGFTNVEFVNAAIGAPSGEVEFVVDDGTNSHLPGMYPGDLDMREVWKRQDDAKPRGRVECISFDQACFDRHLPRPDLIKMDIEGAEIEALRYGQRMFAEVRPWLLLELHNPECDLAAWEFSRVCRYELLSLDTGKVFEAALDVRGTLLCRPLEQRPA